MCTFVLYSPPIGQSLTLNPKEEPKPREAHPTRHEDSTSKPIPKGGPAPPHGSSKRRHLLYPPGPVHPSLTPRRWKDALVRYRSMCAPSKTPSASYRDSLPREGSRSFERGGRVSPAPRSSRLLDRLTSRAPVNRALRVTPANSNILRLQEPRRPTPDAGSPPRHCGVQPTLRSRARTVGSDGPCLVRRVRALGRRSGRRADALAPGRRRNTRSTGTGAASSQRLPSPISSQQNNQHLKPHNRRSASGGLNKTPVCH